MKKNSNRDIFGNRKYNKSYDDNKAEEIIFKPNDVPKGCHYLGQLLKFDGNPSYKEAGLMYFKLRKEYEKYDAKKSIVSLLDYLGDEFFVNTVSGADNYGKYEKDEVYQAKVEARMMQFEQGINEMYVKSNEISASANAPKW